MYVSKAGAITSRLEEIRGKKAKLCTEGSRSKGKRNTLVLCLMSLLCKSLEWSVMAVVT